MPDHSTMKLGKKPPKHDIRTLRLARYLPPALPAPPDSCDWSNSQPDWGMMDNDQLGCCTIAACGHAIQVWTLVINQRVTVPDDVILHYYEVWDGYNPTDPNSDQGGVELDVLNKWRQQTFNGHSLQAYAAVDTNNLTNVKQAVALFGGTYIGVALPISAQSQDIWDAVSGPEGEPGSWGGHAVFCLAYDVSGITCITWGQLKKMTWAFWEKYVDEAYALLSPDFIAQSGLAPSNFDLATLQSDLNVITT